MPKKKTVRVKPHIRREYAIKDKFSGLTIENPFGKRTKVKGYKRSRPKKK